MNDKEWIELLGMTVRKKLPDGVSEPYVVISVFDRPAVQLKNLKDGEVILFTVDSLNGQDWFVATTN